MSAFVKKFATSIIAALGCFDRVILKGHLPFGGDAQLNAFVDQTLRIRRKDFIPMLEKHSQQLVEHAKSLANAAGRPYEYRQGKFRKEASIQGIIQRDRLSEGLVAVLCCQETCRTVKLRYGAGRPELCFVYRPQRVLYYYSIDPDFGLMYVRVQTWFPYTIQVYVNGPDWLARQMSRQKIGFCQRDNAFTQLDSAKRAQQLADRFCRLPWIRQLDPSMQSATANGVVSHESRSGQFLSVPAGGANRQPMLLGSPLGRRRPCAVLPAGSTAR